LEPAWEPAGNHIVLVVAIRGEPSATGFEVEAIDPWKAERTTLYFHREANGQTSTVLKGSEANGSWIAGHPFLQVLAPGVPTLRPANLEWHERYLVVANYLIGRF
ncbi:MAG TPA: hypothetical protein PLA50_07715, partial [Bacteroidia bacterium]|nr:hypothetical protein [Bacteroidia bacterium]